MKNKRKAKKVLLIGWDAADWKVINPLIDAGKMPTLEKLINNGVMGKLATLDPPLSPMLWTTIATGKTADEHGIIGFTQPDKESQTIHPVLSTSRKVKALWNILMQNGMKSNVIGWWPSHPAEPINGAYVSNFYHKLGKKINHRKPLAKDTVHPKKFHDILEELRVFPWELTAEHLLPFVPKAAEIDQEKDQRLYSVAKILAETSTIHAAATYLMENTDWDFTAVYFDGIDHFGHGFMNYHPPKMDIVSQKDYDLYKGVVEAGYRFHDMMLERLLELAGEDTTVILVSDHGFHSDHLRPKKLSNAPAAPAAQHNPYGIFAAKGPHLRKDELVFGSTLKDITPTILDLFGLPIGKDMSGKPILQIYEKAEKPKYIESWENIEGDCGMHSEEKRNDPWAEKEAMDQLIALGYIEPPGENIKENLDKSALEAKYYLARVYMDSNNYKKALPILEAIHSAKPEIKRYSLYLIKCYLELKEPEKALEIFEELKQQTEKMSAGLNLLAGKLYLALNKVDKALHYLKNAEKQDTDRPGIFLQLGQVYLKKKYSDKAITVFQKAIKIDNQNAMGYFGLGRGYFLQKRFSKAAEEFITAIGLLYHFPQAHYFLGESLFRLKIYDNALEAFKITINQAPGLELAHKRLINLYDNIFKNKHEADKHRNFIKEKIMKDAKMKEAE